MPRTSFTFCGCSSLKSSVSFIWARSYDRTTPLQKFKVPCGVPVIGMEAIIVSFCRLMAWASRQTSKSRTPDLNFSINFAVPIHPCNVLSMTKGETVVIAGLPRLEAKNQKRGHFISIFEGEAPLSSSWESAKDPSFFPFIKLRSDVVATEPDAAGTGGFERQERMIMVCFHHHKWSPLTKAPNEGTPSMGQCKACRVPGMHRRYIQAQSVLIGAILIRLYTRIAPAICPLKGRHSHDQPIDQIGPDLAARLSEIRAKVVCCNHQDPIVRFTGRSARQTSCLLRSPLMTCRREASYLF